MWLQGSGRAGREAGHTRYAARHASCGPPARDGAPSHLQVGGEAVRHADDHVAEQRARQAVLLVGGQRLAGALHLDHLLLLQAAAGRDGRACMGMNRLARVGGASQGGWGRRTCPRGSAARRPPARAAGAATALLLRLLRCAGCVAACCKACTRRLQRPSVATCSSGTRSIACLRCQDSTSAATPAAARQHAMRPVRCCITATSCACACCLARTRLL